MKLPGLAFITRRNDLHAPGGCRALWPVPVLRKTLYSLKASVLHYRFGKEYLQESKTDSCNFMDGAHEHCANYTLLKKEDVRCSATPSRVQERNGDDKQERTPFSIFMKQEPA